MMFRKLVRYNVERLRLINRKYAVPKIEMSGAVKLSLPLLRLYLILLVGLLVFKFISLVK
jgi:hypothetical protein